MEDVPCELLIFKIFLEEMLWGYKVQMNWLER